MKHPIVFVIMQTGASANGGVQSITEIMRRLKVHRPIVLTNLDTDATRSWRSFGIEVHIVPEKASAGLIRSPAGTIRTYLRYRRALAGILGTTGVSVIHANDPLAFQLSFAAAKLSRTPITLNLRDTLDPNRRPPGFKFHTIFAAADHVFYLSADMAEHWRKVAANAMRSSSVTYSIVDPERFAASPITADGEPVVLVPGVFWPKKGQLQFIRNVVPALAEHGIETWFAGDFEPDTNPYAAACAEAAQAYAGRVRFLGYRKDLPDLYREASVVAVPSRHEGLVRGMIEAMSCGRPVVSFDVCSAREILEQKSGGAGIVVPMGDYARMADALIHYSIDRSDQAAAGRAASASARILFEPDEVVERHERVYCALVKD